MTKQIVTQEHLLEATVYFPETGELIWKERPITHFKNAKGMKSFNSRFAGKKIGTILEGYLSTILYGKQYMVHNLIWLYMTGSFPSQFVDHENHDRLDNRWCNLKQVSFGDNLKNKGRYRNNKSGITGVYWSRRNGKWTTTISLDGKHKHLGYFDQIEMAQNARKSAELDHQYHRNHGV